MADSQDFEEGVFTPTMVQKRRGRQFWKKKYNTTMRYIRVGDTVIVTSDLDTPAETIISRIKDTDND